MNFRFAAAAVFAAALLILGTPANAQSMEKLFKVTLLGTGAPPPIQTRASYSLLIEAGGQQIIIDAGRRSFQRIADALGPGPKVRGKINFLDKIFVTHLHSDHIQGIPDILTTGFQFGRKGPLQVWGPKGTKSMMFHIEKAYEFDIMVRTNWGKNRPEAYKQVSMDIEPGFVWKKGGVSVRAFLVDHKEIKPAYGYVVEFDGRKAVFSGDTIFTPSIIKEATGADLLVHQVADVSAKLMKKSPKRFKRIMGHHTMPNEIAKILNQAKPRFTALSHLVLFGVTKKSVLAKITKDTKEPVIMGNDLMQIMVGKSETKVIKQGIASK